MYVVKILIKWKNLFRSKKSVLDKRIRLLLKNLDFFINPALHWIV